ncbi:MAG: hypothetical protein B9S30_07990 [Verrucomicrobiia bacterium Tous-C5FEB]|nr:MAG: hypothetical protein B9S30_07990 [Verrucomicrobiae bacterium Tous-C5FEB]
MTLTLPHLMRDSSGTLWIDNSGYRVVDLAAEHLAHGWNADTLQENHPDLSLAQIHAALAWFYDHEDEIRQEMRQREASATMRLSEIGESPLLSRLREIKLARR